MKPLRRILLTLMLAVTMIVTNSYAQPSHDECGCCNEAQQMMCAACKVCSAPGLLASPVLFIIEAHTETIATLVTLNPSRHTEDIWHPPKRAS